MHKRVLGWFAAAVVVLQISQAAAAPVLDPVPTPNPLRPLVPPPSCSGNEPGCTVLKPQCKSWQVLDRRKNVCIPSTPPAPGAVVSSPFEDAYVQAALAAMFLLGFGMGFGLALARRAMSRDEDAGHDTDEKKAVAEWQSRDEPEPERAPPVGAREPRDDDSSVGDASIEHGTTVQRDPMNVPPPALPKLSSAASAIPRAVDIGSERAAGLPPDWTDHTAPSLPRFDANRAAGATRAIFETLNPTPERMRELPAALRERESGPQLAQAYFKVLSRLYDDDEVIARWPLVQEDLRRFLALCFGRDDVVLVAPRPGSSFDPRDMQDFSRKTSGARSTVERLLVPGFRAGDITVRAVVETG